MRHPARVACWVALFTALAAAPAAGQTDYRNLDEGRPAQIEDALPVDHYGFELTLPYELESRDGTRLHRTSPELVYGVTRGGELGLTLPLAARDREAGTTWALAGARLFALQNLMRERPGAPAVALRADLDLPVGGLAGDATALSLKALATRNWGTLRLHANASVNVTGGNDAGPVPQPDWAAGLALDQTAFRSSLLVLGELVALGAPGGTTEVSAGAGLRWQLGPTLVLDAGVHRRLGEAGPDLGLTVGLSHAFGLAALGPPSRPRPAHAVRPRQDEQFYMPGSFNWRFLADYPDAARLFNAFDYGHAVLYQQLLTRTDADAALGREYRYLTRDLLVRPPRFAVAEEVVMPEYAREMWQAKEMFDWAHLLHRQIYDAYADVRLSRPAREALVERLTDRYLARAGVAFTPTAKPMSLMEAQPFSQTFRRRQPAFNGLIWAYHWLQVGLYEPLVLARSTAEAKSGVATALGRFWQMVQTERYPEMMPMTVAVAPEFTRRHPRAAAIFDNLHMMHDIISDILASPEIPRDRKRAAIEAQLAIFRSDRENAVPPAERPGMTEHHH